MECFFSIVIPAYNSEKHLNKCLKSVLEQRFESFEIIIIDDGSVDNTYEIAKRYEKKDARVRAYKKINGGVASARNMGIINAEGKYIVFLDSDDILNEGVLEQIYSQLSDSDCDMAICNGYVEISGGGEVSFVNIMFGTEILNRNLPTLEVKKLCQNLSSMCIAIYRKQFLEEQKLLIEEGITCGEDTDFFFRALCASKIARIIECTLFSYVYNENSVSNNLEYKSIKDVMCICEKRIHNLLDSPSDQIDNKKALNFFASKYIHFSVKIATLKGNEKYELIARLNNEKDILKYADSAGDMIFAGMTYIFGAKISVYVFDKLVKARNALKRIK